MVVGVLGTIIPPMVVLSIVSIIYNAFITNPYVAVTLKGMQAGVAAVILDVVFGLGANVVKQRNALLVLIMVLAFIATYFFNVNVIYIILAGALAGLLMEYAGKKKGPHDLPQVVPVLLQVGLFSVGGGYVAIPLIQNQVVVLKPLADHERVYRPGHHCRDDARPHRHQFRHLCGHPHRGLSGALVATFGCILPSCIIVSILSYIYTRYKSMSALQGVLSGLRPAVVALIASAGLSILQLVVFAGRDMELGNVQWIGVGLFLSAFLLLRRLKWNPILVMSLCGAVSLALYAALGIS